jgi:hypothetical protein
MISSIYCFFNSEVRNEIVVLIQRKLLQHNPNMSLFNNHVNNERFNSKRLHKASTDRPAAQNLIEDNNAQLNNNNNNVNDNNINLNNLDQIVIINNDGDTSNLLLPKRFFNFFKRKSKKTYRSTSSSSQSKLHRQSKQKQIETQSNDNDNYILSTPISRNSVSTKTRKSVSTKTSLLTDQSHQSLKNLFRSTTRNNSANSNEQLKIKTYVFSDLKHNDV